LKAQWKTAGALCAVLIAAACGGEARPALIEAYGLSVPSAPLGSELNLFTWSDYIDPELVKEFETTYGVTLNIDYYDTNEAMIAKLGAGGTGQYDVVIASDYAVEVLGGQGLLETIDRTNVPNFVNLDPRFTGLPFDPSNIHSAAYQWGTTGLGVRTDLVEDPSRIVESWALVFDSAQAVGPFTMLADPRETIGAALLYLGHSANSTDSTELAEAEQLLTAQRSRVLTYAPFASGKDLLGSGDAVVSHNYSGDVRMLKDEVPGVTYLIPREGALVWTDNLAIPRDAPHKLLAEVFINFILDGDVGARLSDFTQYGSPNALSLPKIDPELLADRGVYPDSSVLGRLEYLHDVGEARALYDRIWTRLRAGG
jgi:spermidine/putrescine transport system substrate-binding protein